MTPLRIALLYLACLLGCDQVVAQPFELHDAPRRFEPQDHAPWTKSTQAAISRADVAAMYQSTYAAGDNVSLQWTGSVARCDPGATNAEHQHAVIARINYFRALVGLPGVGLLAQPETAQDQASALMMSANNALSHTPPSAWLCYTADGATGAGSSNIALGVRGVAAIDLYMDDPGSANSAAGHRRWILFPPQSAMATGDVAGETVRRVPRTHSTSSGPRLRGPPRRTELRGRPPDSFPIRIFHRNRAGGRILSRVRTSRMPQWR